MDRQSRVPGAMGSGETVQERRKHADVNASDGETVASGAWGIDNDYAPLRDVLMGRPEHYRRVDAGPITRRALRNQAKTGVACHYMAPDEAVLHRNFFARDSSVMTP